MLLRRETAAPLRALERLAGLQAQLARPPFVGLWTRLEGFQAEDLARLVRSRKAVRATLMRGTLHLVSTKDYLALRPALQPMLTRGMQAVLGDRVKGVDMDALLEVARECLGAGPRTFEGIRRVLGEAFPKGDERALGYAVRTHLPLVQVPTETRWGYPGAADFALAESWLGRPVPATGDPGALVRRYLAAFGPASVRDAEAWSGLAPLAEAFEALRPRLRVFHDERGRELFDLPQAPRPPADTPAPARLLPEYDNLLLGHADRSRVIADEHRKGLVTRNLVLPATFLVDGFVQGTWKIERSRAAAVLTLKAFDSSSKRAKADLTREGTDLLRFAESDARTREVRFAS